MFVISEDKQIQNHHNSKKVFMTIVLHVFQWNIAFICYNQEFGIRVSHGIFTKRFYLGKDHEEVQLKESSAINDSS